MRTRGPQRSPRLSYVLSPLMSQGRQSDDDLGLLPAFRSQVHLNRLKPKRERTGSCNESPATSGTAVSRGSPRPGVSPAVGFVSSSGGVPWTGSLPRQPQAPAPQSATTAEGSGSFARTRLILNPRLRGWEGPGRPWAGQQPSQPQWEALLGHVVQGALQAPS